MKNIFAGFSNLSELWPNEIEDLKRGAWSIECPRMILKSRSQSNVATFSGSGYIHQDSDHQIEFKLYSSRQRNVKWGGEHTPFVAGKVIPEWAYYDLMVFDFKGRSWTSTRILPDFSWTSSGKPIIEGKLQQLLGEGRLPKSAPHKGGRLEFNILENVNIPCNSLTRQSKSIAGHFRSRSRSLNGWRFRCRGFDFLLVKEEDDSLTIEIHSESERFPVYFEERVIEALQFIFGRPIHWLVMQKWDGRMKSTFVSSKSAENSTMRFLAPLPQRLVDPRTSKLTTAHHRKLFERYLGHVLKYGGMRHPLWGQVNAVHEASGAAFIDAQALTLTVAIESLLAMEFIGLGTLTEREKESIKDAQRFLEGWDGDQRIKDRIRGSIAQLLQVRVADKMRELVELGAITEDQSKAWQKLRNISTHSYQTGSIAPGELLELLQKIEVLFYHLIFYAIGYNGPYVDFSTSGWPIKQYTASVYSKAHSPNALVSSS